MLGTSGRRTKTRTGRRWLALVVLAIAQLMIVLDATIVNVALPTITADLELSAADRQWVITAYTVAFGGLLLLGGRIADYVGRKRVFLIGLLGFAAASAVGGAAVNLTMLLAARAAQGAFGAILAPAALALLTTTFTEARERATAFAVFGAVAAGGSAVGLVLGGLLTQYLNWRWVLYVNTPVALLAAAAAVPVLTGGRAERRGSYDILGALLATGGLVALVYGFAEAEQVGWTDPLTLVLLGVGLGLLAVFVLTEAKVREPMLPLRVVRHRTRGGANLAVLLATMGMFGVFFYLSFYLQQVSGFSPVETGVAFLPVTGGVLLASAVASQLSSRVPPRLLMCAGLLIAAAGMALLTRLDVDSNYAGDVLPSLLLVGIGLGSVFVPSFNAATLGVDQGDAGVASATVNTSQQVGASLGIALLNTIAANAATEYVTGRVPSPRTFLEGQVHGYAAGSMWAAAILAAAAVLIVLLVNARRLGSSPQTATSTPTAVGGTSRQSAAASSAAGTGNWVRCQVRQHDGAPAPDVVLTLLDDAGRQVGRAHTRGDGRCILPDNGSTDAADIRPGSYTVVVTARSFRPAAVPVTVTTTGAARCDVELASSARLQGTARSARDGRVVPDAQVTLTDGSGTVIGVYRTGDDGRYEFDGLAEGSYTLLATGYPTVTEAVRLDPGQHHDEDILLAHPDE